MRLVAEAEEILAGRYRYFGYPSGQVSQPVDFDFDPFSRRSWPRQHGKQIDYRLARFGDPKWIWELNRLQELPLLAAASLLTDDDRYARRGIDLTRRWISTSDPGRGIAWSNGFEAGMRAISLAVFLDAMRGSPLSDPDDVRRICTSLWQHARWIRRDPSTHSSANNHLIGELAGLAVIGLLAPELRDAERLLAQGLDGLANEAERQIAPDGTSVEQAFRYHLFVVDLLLVVVALLDAQCRPCPDQIADALRRSGRALAAQLGVSDPEPTYGDADDAAVLRLDGAELRDARGMCAAIAARLGDPHARGAASRVDAMACWLFGAEGARRFAATEPAEALGSTLLESAGLAILRRGRRRVVLDAGPLGYLATAAHGHADALQVTVADAGEDLVGDPGVGSYFRDSRVRSAFRGTSAHATVCIDGEDQSESGGAFLWNRHASARMLEFDGERGFASAEHDGYSRLPDPVRHRRFVLVDDDGPIVVVDRLRFTSAHQIVQSWPLHPDLDAVVHGDVLRVTRDGHPRLLIAVRGTAPGRLHVFRGERNPLRGWFSRRLEHVEPACLGTWSAAAVGPLDIVALVWPLSGGPWPEPSLELVPGAGEVEVRYVSSGAARIVSLGAARPV